MKLSSGKQKLNNFKRSSIDLESLYNNNKMDREI